MAIVAFGVMIRERFNLHTLSWIQILQLLALEIFHRNWGMGGGGGVVVVSSTQTLSEIK